MGSCQWVAIAFLYPLRTPELVRAVAVLVQQESVQAEPLALGLGPEQVVLSDCPMNHWSMNKQSTAK